MKRILGLSFVVIALAVLAWLWTRAESAPAVDSARPEAGAAAAVEREVESPELIEGEELAVARVEASSAPTRTETDAAAANAPELATIRVRVVDLASGVAQPGVRVLANPSDRRAGLRWSNIDGSLASPGECALTDGDGRATLLVHADVAHSVLVMDVRRGIPETDVGPLAPGAVLDLDIDSPLPPARAFCGRLVDAESNAPIVDALAYLTETPDVRTRSDADGVFQLVEHSVSESYVRIEADGYSWAVVRTRRGHETIDQALPIPLSRGAQLEVVVTHASGVAADATVTLQTESYRMSAVAQAADLYLVADPKWRVKTTSSGLAHFIELPPHAPLTLRVKGVGIDHVESVPLVLSPGETRKLAIRLESGARITGRVTTSLGAPAAEVEIWRLAPQNDFEDFVMPERAKPVSVTRSDADGRFTFEDVAPGAWWVGVAAGARVANSTSNRDRYAPVGRRVVIDEHTREAEVLIRTDVGLFLEGVVRAPTGAPATGLVMVKNVASMQFDYQPAKNDGTFAVGPLTSGDYQISATSVGEFADSDTRIVAAGESGIVLELRAGVSLLVHVLEAETIVSDASISVSRLDGAQPPKVLAGFRGATEFTALEPGRYGVAATTTSGLWALRTDVMLRASEAQQLVELRLERGAFLTLTYAGPNAVNSYRVLVDGATFMAEGLERGVPTKWAVPTGVIELRSWAPEGETPESHVLTLAPGETRELTVGK